MDELIKVGMADLNVCIPPKGLTTLGLGSCVGIILYDPITKVSGLAHIMLPDSTKIKNNSNIAKFADTAVDKMIEDMCLLGARKNRLVGKLAGGAQMFSFNSTNDLMRVGERNIIASREKLQALGIRIISEDCGNNYGRTIEFNPESGELLIKTIGKPVKII
ncbi:MAG: chemotaxis protein CheD [Firmicutes bacterium HGW-Firmicutes-1]|jgi:chemotaxis protein CheD|nr:MAG: chemotaxis protein CheD [Firmicutes bacterium HGW-Firmicutes-1]